MPDAGEDLVKKGSTKTGNALPGGALRKFTIQRCLSTLQLFRNTFPSNALSQPLHSMLSFTCLSALLEVLLLCSFLSLAAIRAAMGLQNSIQFNSSIQFVIATQTKSHMMLAVLLIEREAANDSSF